MRPGARRAHGHGHWHLMSTDMRAERFAPWEWQAIILVDGRWGASVDEERLLLVGDHDSFPFFPGRGVDVRGSPRVRGPRPRASGA